MKQIVRLLVVLAVLWSAWWWGAGYMTRSAVSQWFATQADEGWQAEFSSISTTGYPIWHRTRIAYPTLADPQTGVAWRADWLGLESRATQPAKQLLVFPETAQRLSYFDQSLALTANSMQARLHVDPKAQLQVFDLGLSTMAWQVSVEAGTIASGDGIALTMTQGVVAEVYDINAKVENLTIAKSARSLIRIPDALPDAVETLQLDMTVQFTRPWDLTALSENRPQPTAIKLSLAEARWGQLQLLAAGQLDLDAQGIPTGTLTVKAENWRQMLVLAVETGALPAELARPTEQTLRTLARLGGNPDALDIKLTFQNGRMSVGILPLGPAPRIILR